MLCRAGWNAPFHGPGGGETGTVWQARGHVEYGGDVVRSTEWGDTLPGHQGSAL